LCRIRLARDAHEAVERFSEAALRKLLECWIGPLKERLGVCTVDRHDQFRKDVVESLGPWDDSRLVVDNVQGLREACKDGAHSGCVEFRLVDDESVEVHDRGRLSMERVAEIGKWAEVRGACADAPGS
jgi:hypothetical protein